MQKESFLLQFVKENISKINLYAAFVVVFLIPLPLIPITRSYAVDVWLLTWVCDVLIHKKLKSPDYSGNKSIFIVSVIFYFIYLIGVLYSENKSEALSHLVIKLSLFLFPLAFVFRNDLYSKNFKKILLTFVTGNLIAGLLCFVVAFYQSLSFGPDGLIFNDTVPIEHLDFNVPAPSNFFYNNFSFFIHPSYFSLYICFSILILFYFIRKNICKRICLIGILFFLILNFFVSSKAGLLMGLIITFINFIILLNKKMVIISLLVLTFLMIISITFLSNSRFFYVRKLVSHKEILKEKIINKDYKGIIDYYGIMRIPIWLASAEVINENLLFGSGTGDVRLELNKKYIKYNLKDASNQQLNAHNQYFETLIELGIIGFVFLLLFLLLPLVKSIKEKNALLLFLIIIIGYNFLFESMLNRSDGVIFIAFFYNFLIFIKPAGNFQHRPIN